jgi:hypothetical protein
MQIKGKTLSDGAMIVMVLMLENILLMCQPKAEQLKFCLEFQVSFFESY